MPKPEWLAARFEEHRAHLRSVAYRMLDVYVPDPVVTSLAPDPEADAVAADAVGLALLVVLETLKPAERLAFVLHDVFGMAFEEIAPVPDRSPVAARQLASRARRRIQAKAPRADPDRREQRRVVEASLATAREGDLERLVTVLDPEIVLRADGGALGAASRVVRGARDVAGPATSGSFRAALTGACSRCSPSRSRAAGSSRSTSSRIPCDSIGWICPPFGAERGHRERQTGARSRVGRRRRHTEGHLPAAAIVLGGRLAGRT